MPRFGSSHILAASLRANDLTPRSSEPRPTLMRSVSVVSSSSLQRRALPGAVAELESR